MPTLDTTVTLLSASPAGDGTVDTNSNVERATGSAAVDRASSSEKEEPERACDGCGSPIQLRLCLCLLVLYCRYPKPQTPNPKP
jgi:hypothetical protein